MTTKIVTEEFEIGRRKHKGATKPKLPVTQGGVYMRLDPDKATTFLYEADSNVASNVANDVPLRFADYIEDAINMHDELVKALTGASHALRSYQYGNLATGLAKSIADDCDAVLAKAKA